MIIWEVFNCLNADFIYRFAAKLGVVGGTIYYLSEEGVWKRSEESTKIYGKISEAVNPHIQDLKGQLPFKVIILIAYF